MIRTKPRLVALLIAVSMLISMFSLTTVSAANPESLTIDRIAELASAALAEIEAGIQQGKLDVDGIYFDAAYPATFNFTDCEMTAEEYILMMANALYALSKGEASSTAITFKYVSDLSDTAKAVNGKGTSLNKAQYLELAERVAKYGTNMASLPSSFNRPTDGTNVYEGRMTIYSIGHLFAKVLASYSTNGTLPAEMSFQPVHVGDVDVVAAPTEPDDWYAAVIAAAVQVKASMDNNILPGTIMVGPLAVTPAQYFHLCVQVTVGIYNGNTTGTVNLIELAEPANPQGTATGKIYTADYIAMAKKIITWNESNPAAPNYSTSSDIGITNYYDVVHMYTKILNFYSENKALPNYNTVIGWSGKVEDVTTPTTAPTTKPTTAPTTASTAPSESSATESSSQAGEASGWYADVISGAVYLVNYVKDKGLLPSTIPVGTYNLTPAQYLYLCTQVVVALNNGKTSGDLSVPNYNEPSNPQETISGKGNITMSEVATMAQKVVTFMETNGQGPNWMTSSLGTLQYENGIYTFSKPLAYYAENGKLPETVEVNTWFATIGGANGDATFGNDFSAYAKYLVPTANCQSTNATIIAVAKQAMNCPESQSYNSVYTNPSSTYEAMWNLTEFTTYMLDYDYYANSRRGATGVWRDKMGNCCDMAHFTNAMARSLGVPGRYEHWLCKFSSSSEGHVWSALYIPDAPDPNINNENGWIYSDPVNNNCKLGYQSFKLVSEYDDSHCAELGY